jgi:hypothetical protein
MGKFKYNSRSCIIGYYSKQLITKSFNPIEPRPCLVVTSK